MPVPDRQEMSLPATIYLGIVGASVLLILPVFVSAIIQNTGFGAARAGWIGSADLIGYALGSLLAFKLIRLVSWKILGTIGLGLMIAGNFASILTLDSFISLMALRITAAGLGAGLVVAVPYNALGLMPEPERATGHYWTFNVLGGSTALLLFPVLSATWGLVGLFGGLGVLAASAIPVALTARPSDLVSESSLPANSPLLKESDSPQNMSTLVAGLGASEFTLLLSIALFNIGLGGVWAFVDGPARNLGLSGPAIGWILSGTYLVCMLGSGVATWQGKKLGLLVPYVGSMILMALAVAVIANPPSIVIYVFALSLINFGWNYSMTYQFSAVFEKSRSTHTATLIFFAQSIGLMIGPALAGVISQRVSVNSAFYVAAGICLLSAASYRVGFSKN